MTLNEMVEAKEKELIKLSDIFSDSKEGTFDLIFESRTLARHVIAGELRCRVEEANKEQWHYDCNEWRRIGKLRIQELELQIKEVSDGTR